MFLSEEDGEVAKGKGVMLSYWLRDRSINNHAITWEMSKTLQKCYGCGFGDRKCNRCGGQSLYMGKRSGSQARPSPIESRDALNENDYYRQHWDTWLMPQCRRLINNLHQRVSCTHRRIEPTVGSMLKGSSNRGPKKSNRFVLLTQGLPDGPFGFVCTSHVDSGDRYEDNIQEEAEKRGGYTREVKRICGGLAEPAHCVYQYVEDTSSKTCDYEVKSCFLSEGLGCAVRFSDCASHFFFASAFIHRTARPIVIANGRVYTKLDLRNPDCPKVNIFAWGQSKRDRKQQAKGPVAGRTRSKTKKRTRKRKGSGAEATEDSTSEGVLAGASFGETDQDRARWNAMLQNMERGQGHGSQRGHL